MGIETINNDPQKLKTWIDNYKEKTELYYQENPDSLIKLFENELRELGFEFEISNQSIGFMPKHKKVILPLALKYYQLAKEKKKFNEQNHFLSFFQFKGFDSVVPMLLEDFCSPTTPTLTRWLISDCLFQIKSRIYTDAYLEIISNYKFGRNRQMFILLVGNLKVEKAIPVLIELLEDEEVRMHALSALGDFKKEEFRCHFERFINAKSSGVRKCAKSAIRKLDKSYEVLNSEKMKL